MSIHTHTVNRCLFCLSLVCKRRACKIAIKYNIRKFDKSLDRPSVENTYENTESYLLFTHKRIKNFIKNRPKSASYAK